MKSHNIEKLIQVMFEMTAFLKIGFGVGPITIKKWIAELNNILNDETQTGKKESKKI